MNGFEIKILDFIQKVFKCGFMDEFMKIMSILGDKGLIWILIALVLIINKKTRKIGITTGLALILGLIVGNALLKNIVGRIRPYDFNPQIDLIVSKLSDSSFPSGHSVSSFSAAVVLLIKDKRIGIPALVLASIIAFSRLYLYVHFPTDVLSGAIIGIAVAFLSCYIVNKLYEKFFFKKIK